MEFDRHHIDVVLIVDDVPDNLSMLHDALDEFGYTVLVAVNGEQALQRARRRSPTSILMDALNRAWTASRRCAAPEGRARHRRHPGDLHDRPDRRRERAEGLPERWRRLRAQSRSGRWRCLRAHRGARAGRGSKRRQARNALDAFGHATLSVRAADGRILWQTPLALQPARAARGRRRRAAPAPCSTGCGAGRGARHPAARRSR